MQSVHLLLPGVFGQVLPILAGEGPSIAHESTG